MNFYEQGIFHIYNQGNNKRQIFFEEANYEYFVFLLRCHLLPYGTFIAWCLMPNHFHILFQVDRMYMSAAQLKKIRTSLSNERKHEKYGDQAMIIQTPETDEINDHFRTINASIGILQRSYARAINRRYGWSGSVFRTRCKAKDGWDDSLNPNDIAPPTSDNDQYNYVDTCFNYIHDNPVKANMAIKAEDYEWSSAKTYTNGIFCPLLITEKVGELV